MMNKKEEAKRDYQQKRERTGFERALSDWLEKLKTTNYILMLILMVLIGIFISQVVANISP